MLRATIKRVLDTFRKNRIEPIFSSKSDYGARFIQVIMTVDGVPYSVPDNVVVTINAKRRDGKDARFTGDVNEDGSVTVPITQWMLSMVGDVVCTVSVTADEMISTTPFLITVTPAEVNAYVNEDDPQYDLLSQVLLNEETRQKQFEDMVEHINSLEQGKQGPVGPVGMHIGPEAPTDGQVAWIDTNEEPSAEEGGVNFDVVAKPGQVIAVKAVDVEGKPKEYKAVDLPVAVQPDLAANEGEAGHVANRTHYVDEKGVVHKLPNKFIDADWMATSWEYISQEIVIPEQTVTVTWNNRQMDIQPGIIYDVHINGVVYPCVASNDEDGGIILGNNMDLTLNNIPFCIYFAGGTATGGFFYKDSSVLSDPVNMKVTGHSYKNYNKLPKEFLPDISWDNVVDKPFVEDIGELLFSHTSTFATDNASEKITGVSLSLTVGAEYWFEINGDMVKCHCENAGTATYALYDADGNMWLKKVTTFVYVYGRTAGTYAYKLYKTADNIVLDPQYIPSSIARKSDIPTGGGTGGTSIDVTAQVGQTIIVKEVDASGKPTKWESADYQPRTHYTAEAEILPENVFTFDDGMAILGSFYLTVGDTYKVIWNGTEYECVAIDVAQVMEGTTGALLGNLADYGLEDTGEPFIIIASDAFGGAICTPIDVDNVTSAKIKIIGNVDVQIPEKYIPSDIRPFYVNIIEEENPGGTTYSTLVAQTDLKAALDANRHVMAKLTQADGDICIGHLLYSTADAAMVQFITGTPSLNMIGLTATDDGYYTVAVGTD